jgi:hypothetical protein
MNIQKALVIAGMKNLCVGPALFLNSSSPIIKNVSATDEMHIVIVSI